MNQTRQFVGYFIMFLAASMIWQSWTKHQEDLRDKHNSTLPKTANKHVDKISESTSIEVAPQNRLISKDRSDKGKNRQAWW